MRLDTFRLYRHKDGRTWLLYNGKIVLADDRPFYPSADTLKTVLAAYGGVGKKRLKTLNVSDIAPTVIRVTHPLFYRPLESPCA